MVDQQKLACKRTCGACYILRCSVLQCVAVLLQCVAVSVSVLQCGAVWCTVVQCGAVAEVGPQTHVRRELYVECFGVLQCVAVSCSA